MTDDKVNILLVDDQPAKLLTYEAILRDLGENLIPANSAREALEHLLKKDAAVVLVDVYMPDTDGFELAAFGVGQGLEDGLGAGIGDRAGQIEIKAVSGVFPGHRESKNFIDRMKIHHSSLPA